MELVESITARVARQITVHNVCATCVYLLLCELGEMLIGWLCGLDVIVDDDANTCIHGACKCALHLFLGDSCASDFSWLAQNHVVHTVF